MSYTCPRLPLTEVERIVDKLVWHRGSPTDRLYISRWSECASEENTVGPAHYATQPLGKRYWRCIWRTGKNPKQYCLSVDSATYFTLCDDLIDLRSVKFTSTTSNIFFRRRQCRRPTNAICQCYQNAFGDKNTTRLFLNTPFRFWNSQKYANLSLKKSHQSMKWTFCAHHVTQRPQNWAIHSRKQDKSVGWSATLHTPYVTSPTTKVHF